MRSYRRHAADAARVLDQAVVEIRVPHALAVGLHRVVVVEPAAEAPPAPARSASRRRDVV